MRRSYQYQLRPTHKQSIALDKMIEGQRRLYNWALEQRKTSWEQHKKHVSLYDQSKLLPLMKKNDEWAYLAKYSAGMSQETLKRLDRAFDAFFRRLKKGEAPGYPRFRGQGWFGTVRLDLGKGGVQWNSQYTGRNHPTNRGLRKKKSTITLYVQGVGHIRVNQHRPLTGAPKTVDITRKTRGRWVVSISCENVAPELLPPTDHEIGIDLGVTELVATSDGELVSNPRYMKNQAGKVAAVQRVLSRKKKGSSRWINAKKRLSRLKEKEHLQRQDHHRKLARRLIEQASVIYVEDLSIKQMLMSDGKHGDMAKRGLNRSISDAGWASFITYLTNKAESAGRLVVRVNPAYTSQTCRDCGHVSGENRNGIRFKCVKCGFEGHADVLAALNILDRGQGLTSLDGSKLTVESVTL